MSDNSIHAFVTDVNHLFSLKCTNLIKFTSSSKKMVLIYAGVIEFHSLAFHRTKLIQPLLPNPDFCNEHVSYTFTKIYL